MQADCPINNVHEFSLLRTENLVMGAETHISAIFYCKYCLDIRDLEMVRDEKDVSGVPQSFPNE